jgi:phosphatidylglycerol:prolipoprotein diacylglycerol transferase
MLIHTVFDLLAWTVAFLMARFVSSKGWLHQSRTPTRDPGYFIALSLGAIAGALTFGSFNLVLSHLWQIGHSIAGAIAGGIVAVEIYKLARGIKGSTGVQFVAPLATGIAVGRLGCFLAGLPDYTYGTATTLPWGVDFGDGIQRHPVQLYESIAMVSFLAVYLREIARHNAFVLRQGFYLFAGFYAAQRFAWEFFKPYSTVIGPLNIFHVICLVMLAYSLFMMRGNDELRQAV